MLDTVRSANAHEIQVESIQQDIHRMIEELPLESLKMIQQFTAFLQQQASDVEVSEKPQRSLKIVTVPASQVIKLAGALPTGYEGDALLDSEAYFDDI